MKKEEIKDQNPQQEEKTTQEEKTMPQAEKSGKSGDTGISGKAGNTGDTGDAGKSGDTGDTGESGKAGDTGVSGKARKSGISGISGGQEPPAGILFPKDISLDDCERQAVMNIIKVVAAEIKTGILSQTTISQMLKALHHDRDVAAAVHEGEIKGRNTRIEEYLVRRKKAEGIHQPSSTAHTLTPTLPYSRIGGLSAADRQTIWERGNEKRVKY